MEHVVPWKDFVALITPGDRAQAISCRSDAARSLHACMDPTRFASFFCDVKRSANMYPACLEGLSTCPQP
jgi:hypothetical protein